MDKPMPDFIFKAMCFIYKFRDWLHPREEILKEVKIDPGVHILDYGCGPGSYSIAAAELVGTTGRVYSLDIHPLAVERVKTAAAEKGFKNIETIRSNCATNLEGNTLDVVLLTDIFHMLSEPNLVLEEIYRVLKPKGVLAFNDHHMKENEILAKVASGGLFELSKKGKRIYIFKKRGVVTGESAQRIQLAV